MLNNKNKKNTFKEFIQGNGFYVLTGVALIAVVVTAMVLPRKGEGNVAKEADKYANNKSVSAAEDISELRIPTIEPRIELEEELEGELEVSEGTQDETPEPEPDKGKVEDDVAAQDPDELISETFSSTTTDQEEIFHNDDSMFSWPVEEQIIYGYSDNDTGNSFMNPTLERTMRSFGLFLKAERDTNIKSAGYGKILDVTKYPTADMPKDMDYPQVGLAVIVDHGNDWKSVYGLHTGESAVQIGDIVQAGDIIGSVGKPSQDFLATGSNLYFQILKNNVPVNPKDMLK